VYENGDDRDKEKKEEPEEGGKKEDENSTIRMFPEGLGKLMPFFHGAI